MEENKLCQCCRKNQAVRVYEEEGRREFYCLSCYSKQFLRESAEGDSLDACPYCGMTLVEAKKGKLVGCAHCYRTMQAGLMPLVEKMQGNRAHRGKTPPLDEAYGDPYDTKESPLNAYRAQAVQKARYERQRRELKVIIGKLKAERNFEAARGYEEKLQAMENLSTIEEDFVWRTRSLSKKP